MVAISSTAGNQAITQAAFQQLKVQQARQNAAKAEQVADALAAKASEAQRNADQAQENARNLTVQSDQARTVAGQARQGVAMLQSTSAMGVRLANTVSQATERLVSQQADSTASQSKASPVLNTSGQLTGVMVNTSA